MNLVERRLGFSASGGFIRRHFSDGPLENEQHLHDGLRKVIAHAHVRNNWFIPEFVETALRNIGDYLNEESLEKFTAGLGEVKPKTVAVICAGNIPLVGFHDIMCVLLSGHRALVKLSSDDDVLLPFMLKLLVHYQSAFEEAITFSQGKLADFEAVIATGSNNTSGYFQYYFGKYPHIIRKNRSSVAILTGGETDEELKALGKDIFLYFGLGCRNVSKLLVPSGYSFDRFFNAMVDYGFALNNNKYGNNYDYNRALYLLGGHKFLDNNFLMVKRDEGLHAPVAVVFFEEREGESAQAWLREHEGEIQCVVGRGHVPFGYSQHPVITDFADNVDTLSFCLHL
jgi:hypothetical protein